MPSLPDTIGSFQVLAELGRGGMGIVYRVKDPASGQQAALKIIQPEALARPDSALRFKREFRAMQRVEHPNVIRVFEGGTHDGCPFFTMELIEGQDIKRWLDGDDPIVPGTGKEPPPAGPLSEHQRRRLNDPVRVKKIADAAVQVAHALTTIHGHRIVHRDLKPDNILVSKAGIVKLMDFGIAKSIAGPSENSSGGMVVGTFKYLSPEQALGADVDGRADLYCLGIVLYELLAGRHPFYSESSVGYAYHHARKSPPDIARFNPEVHKGLKAVCERLVKKDPRERFPTAEDVVAAIREAMDGFVEEMSQRLKPVARGQKLPFALAADQVFSPALVARAGEQRALLAAAEQLLAGRGAVAAVTGRRGAGKSRLVREVAGLARARNIDFVWGTCPPSGGLPYQPFLDILDQLIEDATRHLPADSTRRLLGDEGRVLARYVPAMERIDPAARPKPAPTLDPQGERVRFVSAVTAFLGRCAARQPRVLVVDDIHHADELSLQLMRHLAETVARGEPASDGPSHRFPPVALMFTLDPGDGQAEDARALLSRLSQDRSFLSLGLPPLNPDEVREMLASMIGGGDVAQALADYLHHETGGIPGLIEERVRAWAESGELRRKGRQWVLMRSAGRGDADEGAPETGAAHSDAEGSHFPEVEVRAATRADLRVLELGDAAHDKRIARLSSLARDVAERMAVAGDRVHGSLLERIALRTEEELLDALDELLKRDVIAEHKGELVFRFTENAEREALLRGLRAERRQHLSLLVARAIDEDSKRHRRKINPEEQARLYSDGGEPVRAIEQLMLAARLSLAASATQAAAQRVGEAQELLQRELKDRPSDQSLIRCDVDLVLLRLDVLAAVNIHADCVALAGRRLPRLRETVDSRLVGELILRLAASERVLGNLDEALIHVGEVLSTTERGGNHGLRCRAKSLCGQIYEQRGQHDLAERYFSDALELARAIGDEEEEERARAAVASRRMLAGDLEPARIDFDRLLKQAEARGEKLRIIGYVNSLGIIAHERANYDDAEVAYRRMIELAKPTGDRRSLAIAHGNIGVVRRDQKRFNDALSQCERAARILRELNQLDALAYIRIVESQTHLDRAVTPGADASADHGLALERAREARELSERTSAALRLAEATICLGLAQVRLGQHDRGAPLIVRGLESARAVGAHRICLFGMSAVVESAVLSGDSAKALQVLREVLQMARDTGFTRFVSRIEDLAARLHLDA